jgi:hypothetical protein
MALIGVVWLIIGACVVLVVCFGPKLERWYETPKELRGDWWPEFESEFRAYVRRNSPPPTRRPRPRDRERFDQ